MPAPFGDKLRKVIAPAHGRSKSGVASLGYAGGVYLKANDV